MKKTLLLFVLTLLSTLAVSASDAEINGICYNLDASTKQAEVTYYYPGYYSGNVVIPETVTPILRRRGKAEDLLGGSQDLAGTT